MPGSAESALVFLVLVVPGFLAIAGYRRGRAAPEQPEGLVAAARVIATSAVIALVAWRLGGEAVFDHARDGTALEEDESHTFRFAVGLLIAPPVAGFVFGEIVDGAAHRVAKARDKLPSQATGVKARRRTQVRRRLLEILSARLLHEGPSTWDRTWKELRRTRPFVYVRVTTKGGKEIVGTVAARSRIAVSPQQRDLYIEQVLRQADDGHYYPTQYGLGAFVAGNEIESIEWVSEEGLYRPEQDDGGA